MKNKEAEVEGQSKSNMFCVYNEQVGRLLEATFEENKSQQAAEDMRAFT